MELLSTILPTSTAQMMKLEDVATKCVIASVTMDVNNPSEEKSDLCSPSLCDSSVKTCEEDKHSNNSNKGFIKSLRRAERYVAEFDNSRPVRPKLSYGAMCALAIQVFRNALINTTYPFYFFLKGIFSSNHSSNFVLEFSRWQSYFERDIRLHC